MLLVPASPTSSSSGSGGNGGGSDGSRGGGQGRGEGRRRDQQQQQQQHAPWSSSPKALCLVALAVQNAALAIVMHHSRVSVPADRRFNTATAVLLVELLKGAISLAVAYCSLTEHSRRWHTLLREIGSADCLKLAVPAALYVLQQRLQYAAAANLDPTTFTVSYQAKILTTALFSFLLLRTRIHAVQWVALISLALGVGMVQVQSLEARRAISTLEHTMHQAQAKAAGAGGGGSGESFFLAQYHSRLLSGLTTPFVQQRDQTLPAGDRPYHAAMNPFVGFLAVGAACLTSGFAGVYFEMLLKGRTSKAPSSLRSELPRHVTPASPRSRSKPALDARSAQLPSLWIRNVQLSLLSLPPALMPVIYNAFFRPASSPHKLATWAHLGTPAAILTIAMQVLGGILTALVIKHADNILKGFAVACSVLLSFAWSVLVLGSEPGADGTGGVRFNVWFVLGSALTIGSTFLYNRHASDGAHDQRRRRRRRQRGGPGLLSSGGSSSSDEDVDERNGKSPLRRDKDKLEAVPLQGIRAHSATASSSPADPVVVSSVWNAVSGRAHHHHTQHHHASKSVSSSGRSATPSPDPLLRERGNSWTTTTAPLQGGAQRAPQYPRGMPGSSVAPRLMAEAGAAWATVLSYSQIPLATAADEDDEAEGRTRSSGAAASSSSSSSHRSDTTSSSRKARHSTVSHSAQVDAGPVLARGDDDEAGPFSERRRGSQLARSAADGSAQRRAAPSPLPSK